MEELKLGGRYAFAYLKSVFIFICKIYERCIKFMSGLPSVLYVLFEIALISALISIVACHIAAIQKNRRTWLEKKGSNLLFSYFCGTGQLQRKLIYQSAYALLHNYKWWFYSFAGIAYRIGNVTLNSKFLLFLISLLYVQAAVMGIIEMAIRNIVGTVWLLSASLFHRLLLGCLHLITVILIPVARLLDKTVRVWQHCPDCYAKFNLPIFVCPTCRRTHNMLIPSDTGILFARCQCGKFLPALTFTGRSTLKAACPKCARQLAAANGKQFSIQLIGGNAAGKTAFLAAFQHIYMHLNAKAEKITGYPPDIFFDLEKVYLCGVTKASSSLESNVCNFVHNKGMSLKQRNLVFYDIPDEVILSDTYERNPINYGYANGIVLVIDPLSSPGVRKECLLNEELNNHDFYSEDDVEDLTIQFIQQFSKIVGRTAGKMIKIPLAVVINKTDIKTVKRKIGFPKIKTIYNANPEKYNHDMDRAVHEVCREYLFEIGLRNMVNNLESTFSNIHYFPVSAMGHSSVWGKSFEPAGIMEPIVWIGTVGNAEMKEILVNIRNIMRT